MTKRIVGTTVSTAAEIDALDVGTVIISSGRVRGQVYVQHSPGRWRNGVTGGERWAQALSGIAPLTVVYTPEEGVAPGEDYVIEQVFNHLEYRLPSDSMSAIYGDQVQGVLATSKSFLLREGV